MIHSRFKEDIGLENRYQATPDKKYLLERSYSLEEGKKFQSKIS